MFLAQSGTLLLWGFFFGGKMDWYPWHYKKFKEKTLHLTPEEDGIYRRLIDYYMEIRKPIPSDDVSLARIAGADVACFKLASSKVKAFFKEEKGTLSHKMCDEILDEQDKLAKFRTERAKKGAEARHKKTAENKEISASSKQQALLKPATITVNNNNNLEKEDTKVSSKNKKPSKGTRLPDDWDCSTKLGLWAMDEYGMSRDEVAQEIYSFQDYWKAKTGANAIKLDWDATFRNWIRNNAKWSKK